MVIRIIIRIRRIIGLLGLLGLLELVELFEHSTQTVLPAIGAFANSV
jgi:hypothetical protein